MARHVAVKWLRRLVVAFAVGYPIALVVVAATLRYVGERWWISAVALYLPRLGFGAPLLFIAGACQLFRMGRLVLLQAVSALLVTIPLMGFVLPWPTGSERGKPSIRVLSFNVNSGHGGAQAVVDEIVRYSPDIVALQESGDDYPLSGLLGGLYPTLEVSGQFTLATRYTVSSAFEPEKLSYDGRLRSARWNQHVLLTPLGRIVLYNVHPISPREALYGLRGQTGLREEIRTGRLFSGPAATNVETNVGLRSMQVQTFSEAAQRETDPVVIAGDTNLPGLSALLHRYLSPFQDGFLHAGWGLGYTFPTDRWRPWMRIDRILAVKPLRFVGFEVGRSLASDHRCVVADLQRADP